jgi:hypothetical protein
MKSPKSKGMKFERKLAKLFSAIPGWTGRRQPGSLLIALVEE